MASRPRTTIKRLLPLITSAGQTSREVRSRMPRMYQDAEAQGRNIDPVGQQWQRAVETAAAAHHALDKLASMIAERGGVPYRNVLGLDSFLEIDGERLTLADWAAIVDRPVMVILHRITVLAMEPDLAVYSSHTQEELDSVELYYGPGSLAVGSPRDVEDAEIEDKNEVLTPDDGALIAANANELGAAEEREYLVVNVGGVMVEVSEAVIERNPSDLE